MWSPLVHRPAARRPRRRTLVLAERLSLSGKGVLSERGGRATPSPWKSGERRRERKREGERERERKAERERERKAEREKEKGREREREREKERERARERARARERGALRTDDGECAPSVRL